MPNEFVARNGIIALNNSIITGSLNVTQGVTASLFGTASWANNATTASYVLNAVSASYALSASQAQNAVTASYVLNAVSASYALTSSNVQGGLSRYIPVWSTNTKLTSSVIYQNIDGYIGIGVTDPEVELEITNAFSIRNPDLSAAKARFYWGNEFQTFNIDAYNSGTPWPVGIQTQGGNVGIGTAYAEYILDVIGNGRYTSGLTVTGSLVAPNITGSLLGTASWANRAISSSYALSASQTQNAVTASFVQNAISASFAATASSADNFTVRGTLTAQTIVVQTVTSSVDFVTGSTRFGSTLSNTHQFTGSVGITGSLTVNTNVLSVGGSNVGIGTTAPDSNLQIGSVSTSGNRTIKITDANYGLLLSGGNGLANNYIQSLGTTIPLYFLAGNSNDANYIFSSTGKVAIGLTSPTTKLHVSASTGGVLEVDGAGTSGANALYVSASGNVGIGTATPAARLTIAGENSGIGLIGSANVGSNNYTGISLNGTLSLSAYNLLSSTTDLSLYINRPTGGTIRFREANGAEQVYIGSGGNVGIGTASPDKKLRVTSGDIKISNNYKYIIGDTADADGITITSDGATNNMLIAQNNNAYIKVVTSGASGDIRFFPNTVEQVIFKASGNVGVGTTSPNARLDVSGSAIVSGSFTVSPSNAVELQVTSTGVNLGNISTDIHSVTGSLRVNGSITGSLFGTASYATQALSASYAPGGGGSAFPFTGNAVITGSLNVTAGITGSLLGTASYATQALSASYAPSAGGSAPTAVTFNRVTGSYTFVLTDAGKTVEVSGSTNVSHSLTVPASSSVDFADGTYIDVILYGTGSILFATGSGVTIRSANSWNRIGTRYGAATLINISGNEWYLIGNINA
jgi:hypothetical protein